MKTDWNISDKSLLEMGHYALGAYEMCRDIDTVERHLRDLGWKGDHLESIMEWAKEEASK